MIQGQKWKPEFWQGVLLLLDLLLNFITLGYYGELLSSRVGKGALMNKPNYLVLQKFINTLFLCPLIPKRWRFDEHCFYSIDWEVGLTKHDVSVSIYLKYLETKDTLYLDNLRKIKVEPESIKLL